MVHSISNFGKTTRAATKPNVIISAHCGLKFTVCIDFIDDMTVINGVQ